MESLQSLEVGRGGRGVFFDLDSNQPTRGILKHETHLLTRVRAEMKQL